MANSIPGIGGSSASRQVDIVETSRASKQGVAGTSQSASDRAASPPASDTTDLSNLGNFIADAAKAASAQSSIRPELVASLKAQIAAGTYRPDPDEVAARVAAALKSLELCWQHRQSNRGTGEFAGYCQWLAARQLQIELLTARLELPRCTAFAGRIGEGERGTRFTQQRDSRDAPGASRAMLAEAGVELQPCRLTSSRSA